MAETVHTSARPDVRHVNPLMEHAAVTLVGWDRIVVQVGTFIVRRWGYYEKASITT